MKYTLKSTLLLAISWIIGTKAVILSGAAILVHAIYRATPRGRRARIARIEGKIRRLQADAESHDQLAQDAKQALSRFLDQFPNRQPVTEADRRTVEEHRMTIAAEAEDARADEAKMNSLLKEADRLRRSLAGRQDEPADAPLF